MEYRLKNEMNKAIAERNPNLSARVRDAFRYGYGFDDDQAYRMVHQETGVSRNVWEDLLRKADEGINNILSIHRTISWSPKKNSH